MKTWHHTKTKQRRSKLFVLYVSSITKNKLSEIFYFSDSVFCTFWPDRIQSYLNPFSDEERTIKRFCVDRKRSTWMKTSKLLCFHVTLKGVGRPMLFHFSLKIHHCLQEWKPLDLKQKKTLMNNRTTTKESLDEMRSVTPLSAAGRASQSCGDTGRWCCWENSLLSSGMVCCLHPLLPDFHLPPQVLCPSQVW